MKLEEVLATGLPYKGISKLYNGYDELAREQYLLKYWQCLDIGKPPDVLDSLFPVVAFIYDRKYKGYTKLYDMTNQFNWISVADIKPYMMTRKQLSYESFRSFFSGPYIRPFGYYMDENQHFIKLYDARIFENEWRGYKFKQMVLGNPIDDAD